MKTKSGILTLFIASLVLFLTVGCANCPKCKKGGGGGGGAKNNQNDDLDDEEDQLADERDLLKRQLDDAFARANNGVLNPIAVNPGEGIPAAPVAPSGTPQAPVPPSNNTGGDKTAAPESKSETKARSASSETSESRTPSSESRESLRSLLRSSLEATTHSAAGPERESRRPIAE